MADDSYQDDEDLDNSALPGWTPIVPQSPDHVNWFGEPDLVFGERFFEENSESIADAFSAASADGVPSGKSEDGYEEEWIQSLREGDGAAATHHINLDHKIETVTIVTGIDKAIHLSRLCDANPEIFGVRSLHCVASPPEKAAKGSFKNGCNFLVPQGQNGRPFAGLIHANGKIQITSICSLTAVDPCIRQVVDLLKDAHSRSRAPVIIDYDAVTPLVLMQTELTLRLGLQLPFEVNYDGLQQLFYTNRVFEEPGRSQITVGTTKSPLTTGAGPFFRIERNDFTSGVFHASFCIFRSGKIQARCSKIPADVSAMIAACESVLSILFAHRSQIEAPESGATAKQPRGKGSPPSVPPAAHVQASSAFSYPKALQVVTVTLPREMTEHISKFEQSYTDCAENCLLRFIQIALLNKRGDGRSINSARARELGAAVEISEYFSRWPTAFSQKEYERDQFQARCEWTALTCSRPSPCAYVRRGGFEMQAGATNFLAVLQSMFPRLALPQACMMRNCSKQQLSQGFEAASSFFSTPENKLKFQVVEVKGPTTEKRTNPPQWNWVHPVRGPAMCPHSTAVDWICRAVLEVNGVPTLKFEWWDRDFPAEGAHDSVASGHAQLYDCS